MTLPALLLALAAPAHAEDFGVFDGVDGWKVLNTRTQDGLTIEVRHSLVGEINCFEARAQADTEPSAMIAVVLDVPSAPRWSKTPLPHSDVLRREGDDVVFYQHADVPDWTLVKDRFWVLRGEPAAVGGGHRFRWRRVAASTFPELEARMTGDEVGAVEVPVNWGEWRFTKAEGGATDVRYRTCTDVGGSIPTWLQRVVTRTNLPDVIQALVEETRRRAGG